MKKKIKYLTTITIALLSVTILSLTIADTKSQRTDYMNTLTFDDPGIDTDVEIGDIYAIPTWVQRDDSFEIIPLDPTIDAVNWPANDLDLVTESYKRTISRIGKLLR